MMPLELAEGYILRALAEQDALPFLALLQRNDLRLREFFPNTIAKVTSPEAADEFIKVRLWEASERKNYCFLIEHTSGELAGYFALKNFDWAVPKCEMAYFADAAHEGKGIMSKGMRVVIDYGFDILGVNKFFIRTSPDNIASCRLAERNCFVREGLLRNDFKTWDGTLADSVYYGLIRGQNK